jgi:hypothetical protein
MTMRNNLYRMLLVGLTCLFANPAFGKDTKAYFAGSWESLDTDNRNFRIVQTDDGWEMTAQDLHCTMKLVRNNEDGESIVEEMGTIQAHVDSVCMDEGTTAYSSGQMKLFGSGDYLVTAAMVYRRLGEQDGTDETLKKPEMFVYLYRRAKGRP